MRIKFLLVGAAALALSTGVAMSQEPAGIMMMDTSAGMVLTNEDGMTLYTFDKDEPGKTNCYDQCAINWPPLLVTDGAEPVGDWTIVERDDGPAMWAYKGQPLYLWIEDMEPGDVTGDGVGGVWHVAK